MISEIAAGEVKKTALEILKKEVSQYAGYEVVPSEFAHKGNSQLHSLNEIREERRPEKLIKDVSARMYREGLTPGAWNQAAVDGRKEMLKKAADIMAQEMLLPQDIRRQLLVKFDNLPEKENGNTNMFVRLIDGTNTCQMDQPVITMDQARLINGTCADNYSTLFHEMVHVMQDISITEQIPWTENVSYWRNDYQKYTPPVPGHYISYVTGPMEAYAHAQDALFKKVYSAQEFEKTASPDSFMKQQVSFKGGLSARQGLAITAKSEMSQAKSLRIMAGQCKNPSEAKIMYSRAERLERNAKRLYKSYINETAALEKQKAEKRKN